MVGEEEKRQRSARHRGAYPGDLSQVWIVELDSKHGEFVLVAQALEQDAMDAADWVAGGYTVVEQRDAQLWRSQGQSVLHVNFGQLSPLVVAPSKHSD